MKTTLFRFGRTAACLTLAVALLTGCSLLPAASPRKDPIPVEQPSDASAALDDGARVTTRSIHRCIVGAGDQDADGLLVGCAMVVADLKQVGQTCLEALRQEIEGLRTGVEAPSQCAAVQ